MRTWRWISVLAVLALVLAACGQQGTSEPAEESDAPPATGSEAPEPTDGDTEGPQPGGTLVFGGARLEERRVGKSVWRV